MIVFGGQKLVDVRRWWERLEHIVTPARLAPAVRPVEEAAIKFMDNDARREWVVTSLMSTLKISESAARVLVEVAVQLVKTDAASRAILGSPESM